MTSQKECIEEAIDIFRLVIKEFFEICKSILEAEHHLIIPLARREVSLRTQVAIFENREPEVLQGRATTSGFAKGGRGRRQI